MRPASHLLAALDADQDRVAVDTNGTVLHLPGRLPEGDAVVLVAPVTDALKRVDDGLVLGSFDRAEVVAVRGFVLSREVLAALGDRLLAVRDLYQAVSGLGYGWLPQPFPSP